nr:hypothetical protein Q903MT_gene4674 [Picea sitchensis]
MAMSSINYPTPPLRSTPQRLKYLADPHPSPETSPNPTINTNQQDYKTKLLSNRQQVSSTAFLSGY